jgi:hypothetical protein
MAAERLHVVICRCQIKPSARQLCGLRFVVVIFSGPCGQMAGIIPRMWSTTSFHIHSNSLFTNRSVVPHFLHFSMYTTQETGRWPPVWISQSSFGPVLGRHWAVGSVVKWATNRLLNTSGSAGFFEPHFYSWFQASATMLMRSALFWDITRRRVLFTDVSGQCVGPVFTGQESE